MLGADADRRSGEEKEGGKALNGSQVETVDSMLWESARRQKQPGVSLYEEDLRSRSRPRSRECRDGDHYSKGLWSDDGFEGFVRGPSRPHSCSPRFRPRHTKLSTILTLPSCPSPINRSWGAAVQRAITSPRMPPLLTRIRSSLLRRMGLRTSMLKELLAKQWTLMHLERGVCFERLDILFASLCHSA
ncbi:hypothetical protein BKA83DRAFT_4398449 [Pisolithus microcarpus]|nr:hypothetical protein BKA83DRAFT_4398449 [Pisolithus microcarpus]